VNSARVQTWQDYWQILILRRRPGLHNVRVRGRTRYGRSHLTETAAFLASDFRDNDGDFRFGDEALQLGGNGWGLCENHLVRCFR
jgi:hypothetical protein